MIAIIISIIAFIMELYFISQNEELDFTKSKDLAIAIGIVLHFCFVIGSIISIIYNLK